MDEIVLGLEFHCLELGKPPNRPSCTSITEMNENPGYDVVFDLSSAMTIR